MSDLSRQTCITITKDSPSLNEQQVNELLSDIPQWTVYDSQQVQRTFTFKDYSQTIAFVNAVAWIAQQNDHHPDMHIGYNNCIVMYTSHVKNGLTINDFICAAKIDQLLSDS